MQVKGSGRHRILSNGNLRISNVTKTDSGEYSCEVSNRLGKAKARGFLNVVGMVKNFTLDCGSCNSLTVMRSEEKQLKRLKNTSCAKH